MYTMDHPKFIVSYQQEETIIKHRKESKQINKKQSEALTKYCCVFSEESKETKVHQICS